MKIPKEKLQKAIDTIEKGQENDKTISLTKYIKAICLNIEGLEKILKHKLKNEPTNTKEINQINEALIKFQQALKIEPQKNGKD